MELDNTLAVSPADVHGEIWDLLVARLSQPAGDAASSTGQTRSETFCRREVGADVERLVTQLLAEVDRLLAQFDPALGSAARSAEGWSAAQRASLLAHASGALVECHQSPVPKHVRNDRVDEHAG